MEMNFLHYQISQASVWPLKDINDGGDEESNEEIDGEKLANPIVAQSILAVKINIDDLASYLEDRTDFR